MLEYFVVQAYSMTRMGALAPDTPVQAQGAEHAMRIAARLSEHSPAVIAFSRCGDPATGDYEDAVILACYGDVPGIEPAMLAAS